MNPERLAEIEERAKAATPGPWIYAEANGLWPHVRTRDGVGRYTGEPDIIFAVSASGESFDPPEPFNGGFIAHARQDIPDLLAYVHQLEARNVELERRLIALGGDERRRA